MSRNTMFRTMVALEASRPEAQAEQIARRYGVTVPEVEAWARQFGAAQAAWRRKMARRTLP